MFCVCCPLSCFYFPDVMYPQLLYGKGLLIKNATMISFVRIYCQLSCCTTMQGITPRSWGFAATQPIFVFIIYFSLFCYSFPFSDFTSVYFPYLLFCSACCADLSVWKFNTQVCVWIPITCFRLAQARKITPIKLFYL